MLIRSDPFRDLDRFAQMFFQQSPAARAAALPTAMPMDAYREGNRLAIHFDLPGVDPDSIDLTVEKNVLTVRAERTWEPTEGQQIIVSERPQGTFSRQIFLGEGLDTENIEASYKHGVLTLFLPIAEQPKPRKVAITTEGNGYGDKPQPSIGQQPAGEQPAGQESVGASAPGS
jgi:HSP20 family protein